MNKRSFDRIVAKHVTHSRTEPAPVLFVDKLHTARASLADPAKVAAIDALLAAPEALAAMTPAQVDKRILDIILGK
jgi:hypothetical protein